jgi:hypothetical protein
VAAARNAGGTQCFQETAINSQEAAEKQQDDERGGVVLCSLGRKVTTVAKLRLAASSGKLWRL